MEAEGGEGGFGWDPPPPQVSNSKPEKNPFLKRGGGIPPFFPPAKHHCKPQDGEYAMQCKGQHSHSGTEKQYLFKATLGIGCAGKVDCLQNCPAKMFIGGAGGGGGCLSWLPWSHGPCCLACPAGLDWAWRTRASGRKACQTADSPQTPAVALACGRRRACACPGKGEPSSCRVPSGPAPIVRTCAAGGGGRGGEDVLNGKRMWIINAILRWGRDRCTFICVRSIGGKDAGEGRIKVAPHRGIALLVEAEGCGPGRVVQEEVQDAAVHAFEEGPQHPPHGRVDHHGALKGRGRGRGMERGARTQIGPQEARRTRTTTSNSPRP